MLRTIHKKNKDRYRIQFCDVNFYLTNQPIFEMWKKHFQNLSDVEKIQAWIIGLCCLRRSHDWFGGARISKFIQQEAQHSLKLENLFENTKIKLPNKLSSQLNLVEFINNFRIKAVPESAMRSLCFLSNNTEKNYPLIVSQKIPSPQELLQLQILGKRIISLNEDYKSWPHTLYANRDHLGFLLHDLIHADHFFFEAGHRDGQLGFYKFINLIFDDPRINNLLKSETFKEGFEYIISDMNSHPLHLLQTLHSLVYKELKNDSLANELWRTWGTQISDNSDEQQAFNSVNLKSFNSTMASSIELMCIKMGRSSKKCLESSFTSQTELK